MGAGIRDGDVRTDNHGATRIRGKAGDRAGPNLRLRIRRHQQQAKKGATQRAF